MKMHCRNW